MTNIYCARNYTCTSSMLTHTCVWEEKRGWISNEHTHSHLMKHNARVNAHTLSKRRAHTWISIEQFHFIYSRINYLISQEIKVNIIYPVKSLCVWLFSRSVCWQATLETNYHAVVAQHKTSVWMNAMCVYVYASTNLLQTLSFVVMLQILYISNSGISYLTWFVKCNDDNNDENQLDFN